MDAALQAGFPIHSYESLLVELSPGLVATDGARALLLVDLDDPLDLQAQLGFKAGSALIECLAASFSSELGERATVFRFGDSSCCILIRSIRNNGHARLAAEKLARVAEDTMASLGMPLKPTLRVGIALFPRDATEPDSLLRNAQLALAAARQRGERVLVFDAQCRQQVLEASRLGVEFAAALETGGLAVFYQPKISISDGHVHGVESLSRWLENGRPVATPDVFIPLAEQAGLIHDLTWYVLANSLRTSAELGWLGVAVNVTPGMLHHAEFVEMVESAIESWRVPPGVLTLELTEGALVVDNAEAMLRLNRVRALGARVSIDDFGTGYSSLSYFKTIPADEIKIDKSFVMRMLKHQDDERLVQAIITLAQQFGLEVVAEGVEDEATLAALASLGCDYAQGYLFSPAVDIGRLRGWLADRAVSPVKAAMT